MQDDHGIIIIGIIIIIICMFTHVRFVKILINSRLKHNANNIITTTTFPQNVNN